MLRNSDDEDSGLEINLARIGLEISQMYAYRQGFSITCVAFPLFHFPHCTSLL